MQIIGYVDVAYLPEECRAYKLAAAYVDGVCMTRLNISDGDFVVFAREKMPRPGDACICTIPYAFDGQPVIKRYDSTQNGVNCVSTAYAKWVPLDQRGGLRAYVDWGYAADRIFGAVVACFTHDGTLKWSIDPADLPDALTSTEAGGDCMPVPFSR